MACKGWPCCCSKTDFCIGCEDDPLSDGYEYAILCRFRVSQSFTQDENLIRRPSFDLGQPKNLLSLKLNGTELPIPDFFKTESTTGVPTKSQTGLYNFGYASRTFYSCWSLYYTDAAILDQVKSKMSCSCIEKIAVDPVVIDGAWSYAGDPYYNVYDNPYVVVDLNSNSYFPYPIPTSLLFTYVPEGEQPIKGMAGKWLYDSPKLTKQQISKSIFSNSNELDFTFTSLPFAPLNPTYSELYDTYPIPLWARADVDYIVFRIRNNSVDCVPNVATITSIVENIDTERSNNIYTISGYDRSIIPTFALYDFYDYSGRIVYPNTFDDKCGLSPLTQEDVQAAQNWGLVNDLYPPYVYVVGTVRSNLFNIKNYYGKGGRSFFDLCVSADIANKLSCQKNFPDTPIISIDSCIGQISFELNKSVDNTTENSFGGSRYYFQCNKTINVNGQKYVVAAEGSCSFVSNRPFSGDSYCFSSYMQSSFVYVIYQIKSFASAYDLINNFVDIGPVPSGYRYGISLEEIVDGQEIPLISTYRYIRNGQEVWPDNFARPDGSLYPYNEITSSYAVGDIFTYPSYPSYMNQTIGRVMLCEGGELTSYGRNKNVPYYTLPEDGTENPPKSEAGTCDPFVIGPHTYRRFNDKHTIISRAVSRIEYGSTGIQMQIMKNGQAIDVTRYTDTLFGRYHFWNFLCDNCEGSGYTVVPKQFTITP